MKMVFPFLAILILLVTACEPDRERPAFTPPEPAPEQPFLRGADLSYVNEMEDCGAVYLDTAGGAKDPYAIFADAGTDLVRLRLWYQPDWTDYSNYDDVVKAIARAKAADMEVLLDFHYSDDWRILANKRYQRPGCRL